MTYYLTLDDCLKLVGDSSTVPYNDFLEMAKTLPVELGIKNKMYTDADVDVIIPSIYFKNKDRTFLILTYDGVEDGSFFEFLGIKVLNQLAFFFNYLNETAYSRSPQIATMTSFLPEISKITLKSTSKAENNVLPYDFNSGANAPTDRATSESITEARLPSDQIQVLQNIRNLYQNWIKDIEDLFFGDIIE